MIHNMIRHICSDVSIYIEIGPSLFIMEVGIVVQVAYWQFTSMRRPILFTEKNAKNLQNEVKR